MLIDAAGDRFLTWGSNITFLIVAFAMFLVVKSMNAMKKKPALAAPADPTTKDCPYCFSSISIKVPRCSNCTSKLKG